VSVASNGSDARIGNNQLAAIIPTAPDVIRCDRSTITNIGSYDQEYLCLGNITPRKRATVNSEGRLVRVPSGNHAKPPVVVNVPSAQRDAGEFSHQVRLLRTERGSSIDRDGIFAITALYFPQPLHGELERFVPTRIAK